MTPPPGQYLSAPDGLPLVDLLRRSSIYLAGVEKELAEESGLNTTAARALVLIVEAHEGVEAYSPKALADVLDLTTASMTAVTDKLEGAGFVERRPNVADRRKICLHPTPRGTAEHQHIQEQLAAVMESAVSTLSGEDRKAFRNGLLALAAL